MSETTVNATFDSTTYPEKFKFRFKKTELGNKRADVEIVHNILSLQGVKTILELDVTPKNGSDEEKARVAYNKNQQDLLIESMYGQYRGVIGDWVAQDESNTQEKFVGDNYTWAAIANMPKEDRRSSAIPAETWEAFAKDYAEVMSAVAGRTKDQIASAVLVFSKKFSLVKTNKPVIKFLQSQLGLYMDHTKNGENFLEILDLLVKKADELLKDKAPEDLVANLGM